MHRILTASLKYNGKREYGLKYALLMAMLICILFFSILFSQTAGAVDLMSIDTLEGIVTNTEA